jgi:hypothetical protein
MTARRNNDIDFVNNNIDCFTGKVSRRDVTCSPPSAGPSSEEAESSLSRAIGLNNQACYLVSSGDEDEQSVLEMFHRAITSLSVHARYADTSSDIANVTTAVASFRTKTLPSSPIRTSSPSLSYVEEDAFVNLLDRPILIDEQNSTTTKCYPLYAGCILCNMANLYHRLAIQTSNHESSSHRTQLIAKAYGLYNIVVQSLSDTGLQDDTTLGLCTVALNNIAELYRLEDQQDHLDNVIRHLKSFVAFQQHQRRLEEQQQQNRLQQQHQAEPFLSRPHEPYHLVSSHDLSRITFYLMICKVPILAAAAA